MIYIKLDKNLDKYIDNKYSKFPKIFRKIFSKIKSNNGNIITDKINDLEYLILPTVNEKSIKRLKNMSDMRCWKNVCVSDNLRDNEEFKKFADNKSLVVMDGNWLFKNIVDKIVEYIIDYKGEQIQTQEITILCNNLDETIMEKIREIALKVKLCNVFTNNIKQYRKLEESLYQTNGIVLNVSNNYKRLSNKSNIVINFDFSSRELNRCIFHKNVFIINVNKLINIDEKELNSRNIISCEVNMPEKYSCYKDIFDGFNPSILYESFIYKNTNYKNIKNELNKDNIKILNLKDSKKKIIEIKQPNSSKTLDKITI